MIEFLDKVDSIGEPNQNHLGLDVIGPFEELEQCLLILLFQKVVNLVNDHYLQFILDQGNIFLMRVLWVLSEQ